MGAGIRWCAALLTVLGTVLGGCGYSAQLSAEYGEAGGDENDPPTLSGEILVEFPRADLQRAFSRGTRGGERFAYSQPGRLDDVIDWRIDQTADDFDAAGIKIMRADRRVDGLAMVGMKVVLDSADGTRSALFPGQTGPPLRYAGRRLELRLDNPLRDRRVGYAGPGGVSMDPESGRTVVPHAHVSVTFPGRVVSTNGSLDSRTVTWDLTDFRGATLRATANPPIIWQRWIPVGGAAIVLVVVLVAVSRRQRTAAPAVGETSADPATIDPATGYVVYRAIADSDKADSDKADPG